MSEVTVVVPAYNPGNLLRRALDSVLDQTMKAFDVLVLDDGSSEDLSWVTRLDSRVQLIKQTNVGVSRTRNRGVSIASTRWVAFLDQDDTWSPGKLERQLAAVDGRPDTPFCSTSFTWVGTDGSESVDGLPMTFERLAHDGMVCLSSAMVSRRRFLEVGGQNPLLHQVGDFDLFLKLARGAVAAHVGEPLTRYHYHDANASADYRNAYRERQLVLTLHEIECLRTGDVAGAGACRAGRRRSRSLFGAQAYDAARRAARRGDPADTAGHLARAITWSPGFVTRSVVKSFR